MKKNVNLLWVVTALLLLISCSKREDDLHPKATEPTDDVTFTDGNITELRASGAGLKKTRFLGKGFNLLEYRIGEEQGITSASILDMGKIEQETPWSPWGKEIPSGLLSPELHTEKIYQDVHQESLQDVTHFYSQDSIGISLDGSYKNVTLNFKYSNVKKEEEKVYHARSYAYKLDETVRLEADSYDDYQFYLRPRFVRHLETMSGDELIKTYGTHLITNYTLGAFSDLIVSAKNDIFTKEEVVTLTGSAFKDKVKLSSALSNKVSRNITSIRTIYRQGGSDYVINGVTPISLFSGSSPKQIDITEWSKGIREDDGTFLSLPLNKAGLISIPSLIKKLPLKVKYTCAILHKAHPNTGIVYVLSKPGNYEAVKYNGEYMFTTLNKYESGGCFLYYGNNSVKRISEKLLTGRGSTSANWRCQLEPNGQWVFYFSSIKKYLCTDLVLRSANEDNNGLRYWALNPILPTAGYSPRAWSRVMIKPNI